MTLEQAAEALNINLAEVLERLVGKRSLVIRLLQTFVTDDADIKRAKQALNRQDYVTVAESMHSMKGGAVSLGLNHIEASCVNVIQAVKEKRYSEVSELLETVRQEYTRAAQIIRQEEIQ